MHDTSTSLDKSLDHAARTMALLADNLGRVVRGNPGAIRFLLTAYAAGGHVLLEDVPGTGKTTLAKTLARSIDADFTRVQFTPDLMPSDILGVSVYERESNDFRFHKGPVFTDILLADEINRASPRTQSALLEAMAEGQVSVEGNMLSLGRSFFVIATQNPLEFHGTYPLPESQMDRFALRLTMGYVSPEEEAEILSAQRERHPLEDISACVTLADALTLRSAVASVRISREMIRYIVDLAGATREAEGVRIGASPRGSLALMKCSQAMSLLEGREFVTPETVQELAVPVLAHRLMLDQRAAHAGPGAAREAVESAMDQIPAPA